MNAVFQVHPALKESLDFKVYLGYQGTKEIEGTKDLKAQRGIVVQTE